jgi:DegV family protein with EDD domain
LQSVYIVTDSTADLPKNLMRESGITVVPLKVIFGSTAALRDGVDIETAEFYRRQAERKEFPTTSQPTPSEFAEVYKDLAVRGGSIISIHISSGMSGTVQSARMGAGMVPEADIEVADSRMTSMGLGLIALEAARAARAGKTKDKIMSIIRYMVDQTRVIFAVDTLEYLARGGRIGRAQAFLGTLLNIRPILCLKDGLVHPFEKVRGKARAIDRVAQIAAGSMGGRPVYCSLVHGMDPAGMEQLRQKAVAMLNLTSEPVISELGAVVGTHTGPGVLGIICCPVVE